MNGVINPGRAVFGSGSAVNVQIFVYAVMEMDMMVLLKNRVQLIQIVVQLAALYGMVNSVLMDQMNIILMVILL